MFLGILRKLREEERLEILRKKLKPADLCGVKKCVMCGFCCHVRTCIPTPEEIRKIAEFLKMKVKDMIKKYYAIDKNSNISNFHIKPLGENIIDLGGKFIPEERTWNEGKCIFLGKGNKCKIYNVRPKSARMANCWEEREKSYDEELNKSWDNNVLLKEFGFDGEK